MAAAEPANAEAYLDKMIRLMRADGVRFPDNKVLKFTRLEPLSHSVLHTEGEWQDLTGLADLSGLRVTVTFGPQYGPITAKQVEDCLREAYRRGYDDLVFAGFTIDGAAQAAIQDDPNPRCAATRHTSAPTWRWAICSRTRPAASCSRCLGCRV